MTFHYKPGVHKAMRIFHTERAAKARSLLAVATAVFELEKALRQESVKTAKIYLEDSIGSPALDSIASGLRDLVRFALVQEVDFRFRPAGPFPVREMRGKVDLTRSDSACLFSGGTDSYVGLLLARRGFTNVNAVFCAHHDQSKVIRIVGDLYRRAFGDGPPLRLLSVPGIGKQGYAQLRGFLYFVSAAAWMQLLNASTLIVTECGPTMYQPKFGPFDRVTLTTHPYVVAIAKRVIELLLGREIQILTPFENLTKAEVMTLACGVGGFESTHSCISQRFGSHDGTCYGCIVRRLAAIAAGVADVAYRKDPLLDEHASRSNLLGLLRYNLDYLADWRSMEEYEVGEIESYGKVDLFRRFALDNFAAIHQLLAAGAPLAADVRRVYGYALDALGGDRPLVERVKELREAQLAPAWDVRSPAMPLEENAK